MGSTGAERLVPRWWAASVTAVLVLTVVVGVGGFLVADGLMRVALTLMGLWGLLLLVAATKSLVLPRRRRALPVDRAGVMVIESPALIVWPVVAAVLLLEAGAVVLGVLVVTDVGAVEAPGAAVVAALAALAGLPDTYRLVTGRLHRWRLTLGADGFTYRGYRTDEAVPWSKVHGASVQRRGPAGVLVDRKGAGPDLVVPITAFDVPAEQIVEEIEDRLARRRR